MDLPAALGAFPPVELAFAYGSGVFAQAGYDAPTGAPGGPAPPMVDLVFAVADPTAWHAANLAAHREHYSGLGALGARAVAAVQAAGGGRLYYNTLVPLPPAARGLPGQAMKYGVMSTADLLDDLLHWRHLYVAGRLHKPVRLLACTQPAILAAARENLRHALRAALLMLPARFTATQLYTAIAGLSYTGDFRMVLGENPDKVANIVAGSLPHFHALYSPLLTASFPTVVPLRASLRPAPDAQRSPSALAVPTAPDGTVDLAALLAASDDSGGGGVDAAPPSKAPLHTALELPPLAHDPGRIDVSALAYEQDTSPEARLAVGLGLPYRLQARMAAAAEREADGGLGGRLRQALGLGTNGSSVSVQVGAVPLSTSTAGTGEAPPPPPEGTATAAALPPIKLTGRLGARLQRLASASDERTRRLAAALRVAEAGRVMMRRLRQQRLQWLVARRERSAARREKAAAAVASVGGRIAAVGRGGAGNGGAAVSAAASRAAAAAAARELTESEIRNILEVEAAEQEQQQQEQEREAAQAAATADGAPATAAGGASAFCAPAPAPPPLQQQQHTWAYLRAADDDAIMRFWAAMTERAAAAAAAAAPRAAAATVTAGSPSAAPLPPIGGSKYNAPPPAAGDVAAAVAPYLRPAIAHIVGATARWQSAKGILTAGPSRSVLYAGAKLRKMAGGIAKRLRLK